MSTISSEAVAAWIAAIASFAAVLWGVWQVRADARDKKRQRDEYTHEIASSAENVAVLWDKLASIMVPPDRSRREHSDVNTQIAALRLDLQMFADALEVLLRRPDLSDGAIKCGVRARYLAIKIDDAFERSNGNGERYPDFTRAASDLLRDARRIRKRHGLRPRKERHNFENLDESKIEEELKGVGRRA